MGVLLAASLLLAAFAVRLSTGPINAGSALNGTPFTIDVGSATLSFDGFTLAWEGFHRGVDFPIDLRLENIAVVDAEGHHRVVARQALLSLSISALLRGHIVPRTVELDDGLVSIALDRAGAFNLGMAPEAEAGTSTQNNDRSLDLRSILTGFAQAAGELGQLTRVRLENFSVSIRDEQHGLTLQALGADLDLQRQVAGAIIGSAHVPFILGDQHAELTAQLALPSGANGQIKATLSAIQPVALARMVPSLAVLAKLELPVMLKASLALDPDLRPIDGHAEVTLGAGHIGLGTGHLPIQAGRVLLSASVDRLVIEDARFTLPSSKANLSTELRFSARLQRHAERVSAEAVVTLDHLDLDDLASLWPEGTGGGARPWIVQNVSAGTISHGTVSIVAESDKDFHDVALTKASGDLDGDNVSIIWLAPIPPIERAQVHLHLSDPDKMVITMPSGHQRISKGGADLLVQDGQMLITGLSGREQVTRISLLTEGPVASAITLLKEPRLHLLSNQPLDLKDPSGGTSANVTLDFPLNVNVTADEIVFHVAAHLNRLHLAAIVAGRDLSDGQFDLTADNDGLNVKGQGSLALIPISATGTMDFTAEPPNQVLQRISIHGRPSVAQLVAAGLNVRDVLVSGEVPLTATLLEHRNGEGSVALTADLADAVLQVQPLGWSKRAGTPSTASAMLLLSHDRLASVKNIAAEATDASLAASIDCPDGVLRSIAISKAKFGRTDMHGGIQLPPDQPVSVVLAGPQIDLSAQLEGSSNHSGLTTVELPDWTLDAHFDRALLANGEAAAPLSMQARSSFGLVHELDLTGTIVPATTFFVKVDTTAGQRHLAAQASDAGMFLTGIGLTQAVRSGQLTINGDYDDKIQSHPLDGIARIEDARLVNAPILGKVLQAVTLYGLADLLSGPGIGISNMIVPFKYQQNRLQIIDGRVFSPALGLTVKGMVDLSSNRLALNGTIVPAYLINSVLGHIPLVGKLFSPEVGGGLFAARYTVEGPFGDAKVSVNPLSLLTPGFLRNLFQSSSDKP